MADLFVQVTAIVAVLRDIFLTIAFLVIASILAREGIGGLIRKLLAVARELPAVNTVIEWALKREVRGFLKQMDPDAFSGRKKEALAIPTKGEHACTVGGGASYMTHPQ